MTLVAWPIGLPGNQFVLRLACYGCIWLLTLRNSHGQWWKLSVKSIISLSLSLSCSISLHYLLCYVCWNSTPVYIPCIITKGLWIAILSLYYSNDLLNVKLIIDMILWKILNLLFKMKLISWNVKFISL